MNKALRYIALFCVLGMCSETVGLSKIKEKFQATKEKIAAKFHKEPKETTEATPLSAEQKDYVKKLDTIKKSLTTLLSKIKSTQTEMEKAEKKHKLEGDTSLWMAFQLQTAIISSECNYFLRFVTELHTELSAYNKQANRKGEVEQSVVDYIKGAIDNFCCDGRKINIACARGIFIIAMQYILQNPTCPQAGRAELNTILSGKSLQILAKNKDFSGLLEDVKTSLYSLLDILTSMSLLAEGNSEPDELELEQAKSRFIHNIEGVDAVLSAMQDVIVYIKGGRLSEAKAQARFKELAGDILANSAKEDRNDMATQTDNSLGESANYKFGQSDGRGEPYRNNGGGNSGNYRENGSANYNRNEYRPQYNDMATQANDSLGESTNYKSIKDNNEKFSDHYVGNNYNNVNDDIRNRIRKYTEDDKGSEGYRTSYDRNGGENYKDSGYDNREVATNRNYYSEGSNLPTESSEDSWW